MSDHFDTSPVYPWLKELAGPTGWELGRPHSQSVPCRKRKITSPAGNQTSGLQSSL
jgi:hypothetical protein